jgi:hypothetical protein
LLHSNSKIDFGKRPYRQREVFTPWTKYRRLPNWAPTINLEEGLLRLKEEVLHSSVN